MKIKLLAIAVIIFIFPFICADDNPITTQAIETDLFEEAVDFIIAHEGWHDKQNYPYVGYGHKLTKNDNFNHNISKEFAKSLVIKDLQSKCIVFKGFGKDSLLLGMLAYNIGENKVLSSRLANKLKNGDRNIYHEYIGFCYYKKKLIPSIRQRRIKEYNQFFNKTKIIKTNGFKSR